MVSSNGRDRLLWWQLTSLLLVYLFCRSDKTSPSDRHSVDPCHHGARSVPKTSCNRIDSKLCVKICFDGMPCLNGSMHPNKYGRGLVVLLRCRPSHFRSSAMFRRRQSRSTMKVGLTNSQFCEAAYWTKNCKIYLFSKNQMFTFACEMAWSCLL
jgi:hypothetical protein